MPQLIMLYITRLHQVRRRDILLLLFSSFVIMVIIFILKRSLYIYIFFSINISIFKNTNKFITLKYYFELIILIICYNGYYIHFKEVIIYILFFQSTYQFLRIQINLSLTRLHQVINERH